MRSIAEVWRKTIPAISKQGCSDLGVHTHAHLHHERPPLPQQHKKPASHNTILEATPQHPILSNISRVNCDGQSFWYLQLDSNSKKTMTSALSLLQLQLRQTSLSQPCLDILLLETHLLRADPRRRVHINTVNSQQHPHIFASYERRDLPVNAAPWHPHRYPLAAKPILAKHLQIPWL